MRSKRTNSLPAPVVGQKPGHDPLNPTFEEYLNDIGVTGGSKARALKYGATQGPAQARTTSSRSKPTGPASTTKAAGTGVSSSKKRKSDAITSLEDEIAAYKQNLDHIISPDAFEDDPLPSCNVVRGRINKLIDSGIMTKAEFSKVIGTKTLNNFLQQRGTMGGSGSAVYYNAWAWFRQREVAKLKLPDVKKRQKLEADAAAPAAGPSASSKSGSTSRTSTAASLPDISDVHLPGEETDSVPVYDTCDEIRKKINAHLKTPGLTASQFCRDLYAQLKAPKIKGIQTKQLSDFRGQKGPITGTKSSVFYAAYVYFEKLRIAQGKPESAHREAMRSIHPGGLDLENDHRTGYD